MSFFTLEIYVTGMSWTAPPHYIIFSPRGGRRLPNAPNWQPSFSPGCFLSARESRQASIVCAR